MAELSALTQKLLAHQKACGVRVSSAAEEALQVVAGADIGAAATIHSVQGGSRSARVEAYDAENHAYTCAVTLSCGLEELVKVEAADVKITARQRKAGKTGVRVQAAKYASYFFPEKPNTRLVEWWKAHLAAFEAQDDWLEERGQSGMACTGSPETDAEAIFSAPAVPYILNHGFHLA